MASSLRWNVPDSFVFCSFFHREDAHLCFVHEITQPTYLSLATTPLDVSDAKNVAGHTSRFREFPFPECLVFEGRDQS